jgi:NADPH-dependent 2,4-dienoyl-CoA reductase/sulfur reductase-like enzyme
VRDKGVKLGSHGGIIINDRMETSVPDVYAVGDCCEVKSTVTGEYIFRPLGSTANKMGRIAGDVITGGDLRFRECREQEFLRHSALLLRRQGFRKKRQKIAVSITW